MGVYAPAALRCSQWPLFPPVLFVPSRPVRMNWCTLQPPHDCMAAWRQTQGCHWLAPTTWCTFGSTRCEAGETLCPFVVIPAHLTTRRLRLTGPKLTTMPPPGLFRTSLLLPVDGACSSVHGALLPAPHLQLTPPEFRPEEERGEARAFQATPVTTATRQHCHRFYRSRAFVGSIFGISTNQTLIVQQDGSSRRHKTESN